MSPIDAREADALARRILSCCGAGSVLEVGCGRGLFVRRLLREGVDARGVDADVGAVADANRIAPGRFHCASPLALPFPDDSFDTLVACGALDPSDEREIERALAELRRVARRSVFLLVSAGPRVGRRERWDERAFAAGMRRHPLLLSLVPYGELDGEGDPTALLYEPEPPGLARMSPRDARASIGCESSGHGLRDALRETGRRADASLARYHLACSFVRPRDVVLDLACGLGYGSAMLAANSPASRVIGVDGAGRAIEYARLAYAPPGGIVEFREGEASALDFLADDSIDLAVGFETLEHLADPERFFAELERVLKPAGRVIASVPNDGAGESGSDPNPHPVRVDAWEELAARTSRRFRLERAFAQVAGGSIEFPHARRSLREVPLESAPSEPAEWWLVAAMKDPRAGARSSYRETSFPDHSALPNYHLTSFGRDYDHPWLVKGMVSIGMRTTNERELARLAEAVLESARPGSADAGAALCVLAYRALAESEPSPAAMDVLLERIRDYHEQADESAHAWRWRVSNQYAAGQLELALGRRERALEAFLACGAMDPERFAPILATKAVEALFFAARIALSSGDATKARGALESALRVAERALRGDRVNVYGSVEEPVVFGLPELSQVADLAARAAYALDALDDAALRPGHAWQRANQSLAVQLEQVRRAAKEWEGYYLRRAAEMDAELLAAHRVEQAARVDVERELVERRVEAELARAEAAHLRALIDQRRFTRRTIAFVKRLAPEGSLRHRAGRAVLLRARAAKRAWRGGVPSSDGRPGSGTIQRAKQVAERLRAAPSRLAFDARAKRLARALRPPGREARLVVALELDSFDKGGLEEVVLTLARQLARTGEVGVVVLVVAGEVGHLGERARAAGIPVVPLHRDPRLLRRLLGELRVDVANLHYSVFGAAEYARAGVPIVYTIHNTYVWADERFARERAEAYARVERFLAVSEPAGRFFAARLGVDPARIEFAPNGLDPELLADEVPCTRASLGFGDEDVVFVNAASFNWNKFHVLMIAAMERLVRTHPRARLVLAGNVPDPAVRALVERQVREKGLTEHVRILDYLPKRELVGVMRACDAFLLPSLIEGWSIAVLEAMYCGLPLVLSDVGSARTVIEDEDCGIVVPNPFPDLAALTNEVILRDYTLEPKLANLGALVAAMTRVVEDLDDWKRRGEVGRKKLLERYTARRMSEQYLACFRSLAAARGRG